PAQGRRLRQTRRRRLRPGDDLSRRSRLPHAEDATGRSRPLAGLYRALPQRRWRLRRRSRPAVQRQRLLLRRHHPALARRKMITAYLALGSNLGDRSDYLERALTVLRQSEGVQVTRVSPIYETRPVGGPPGQGAYLNAVAELRTERTA